jgi:hypothetical protein
MSDKQAIKQAMLEASKALKAAEAAHQELAKRLASVETVRVLLRIDVPRV